MFKNDVVLIWTGIKLIKWDERRNNFFSALGGILCQKNWICY